MGNVLSGGSTSSADIYKAADVRYPRKTDVYTRSDADATFATKKSVTELEGNVVAASELTDLSSKMITAQGDIIDLKAGLKTVQDKVDVMEPKVSTLVLRMTSLEGANDDYKNTMSGNLATVNTRLDTVEKNKMNATDASKFATVDQMTTANSAVAALQRDKIDAATARSEFATVSSLGNLNTTVSNLTTRVSGIPLFEANKYYTRQDMDAIMGEFRNSIGLPAANPFLPLSQLAAFKGVDMRFNDQRYTRVPMVPKDEFAPGACAPAVGATASGVPNYARVLMHRNDTAKGETECWSKSSVGQPVKDPAITSYVSIDKKITGSWQNVNSLPDGKTTHLDPKVMPTGQLCLQSSPDLAHVGGTTNMKNDRCDGTQTMTYDPADGTLRNGNMCLTSSGQQVTMNTCPTTLTNWHKWKWTPKGEFKSAVNGKCLDLNYANADPGTSVGVWDCNGSVAQQWLPNSEWAFKWSRVVGPNNTNFPPAGTLAQVGGTITSPNIAECRSKCAADPNCEHFVQTQNNTCFHYRRNPPQVDSASPMLPMVSGIKYPANEMRYSKGTDSKGLDIPGLDYSASRTDNLPACGALCANDPQCDFMTYAQAPNANGHNCFLKKTNMTADGLWAEWKPVGEVNPYLV